nr:ribosome silencing factor [Actinomycetota bacterium]
AEMLAVIGYFVICTGSSVPQVKMLADEIESGLKAAGLPVIGREGVTEATWILLDCGDVVIHDMQPEQREFYRLEKLWGEAPRVSLSTGATDSAVDVDES